MKRFLFALTSFLLLAAFCQSCEHYEKVPENSPFLIDVRVVPSNSGSVRLDVVVVEGVVSGECGISLNLADKKTGGTPVYQLCFPDGSVVLDGATWSFDKEGRAVFDVNGLPSGEYSGQLVVSRWYHSASCKFEFKLN